MDTAVAPRALPRPVQGDTRPPVPRRRRRPVVIALSMVLHAAALLAFFLVPPRTRLGVPIEQDGIEIVMAPGQPEAPPTAQPGGESRPEPTEAEAPPPPPEPAPPQAAQSEPPPEPPTGAGGASAAGGNTRPRANRGATGGDRGAAGSCPTAGIVAAA